VTVLWSSSLASDQIGMIVSASPGAPPAGSGPVRFEDDTFNMAVLCGDHPLGFLFSFTQFTLIATSRRLGMTSMLFEIAAAGKPNAEIG
jgi:hypothetical protein